MARGLGTADDWMVRHGASFLFAADVGEWDRTRYLLLPGQSAEPTSAHYEDFHRPWLTAGMQAMNFSAEAIEASAAARLKFEPPTA